jgi:HD-like signal output (HDOD) protein
MSQDPDVDFGDIEKLLEQDSTLAGEVLSIARSAFYAGQGTVVSLRDALVRLGLAKLREVVMQAAMTARVFRSAAYRDCMEKLRDHCRATAHLSRIVSSYTPIAEEQAFLCGLMHDVGIAGILLVLGDVERGKQAPDLNVLWPAINAAHPRAGARMVELWELPAEIAMAVGAHHDVRIQGHDHPLAATVCLAESMTAELGLAFVPPVENGGDEAGLVEACLTDGIDRTDPAVLERAQSALSLTETMLDLIRSAAREWAAQS